MQRHERSLRVLAALHGRFPTEQVAARGEKAMLIRKAAVELLEGGILDGTPVSRTLRTVGDLANVFRDAAAVRDADSQALVYTVDIYNPSGNPTDGALNFGVTRLEPGRVGTEFYMTKGHLHRVGERTEFYWGIAGAGWVLIGERKGEWHLEQVTPGSVHFIPPFCFHRLINTGGEQLSVGAVWPNDAGHDYDGIDRELIPRVVHEAGEMRVLLGNGSHEG